MSNSNSHILKTIMAGNYRTTITRISPNPHLPNETKILTTSNNLKGAIDSIKQKPFRTCFAIFTDNPSLVYDIDGYRIEILYLKDSEGNTCGTVEGVHPVIGSLFVARPYKRPLPNSKWVDHKTTAKERQATAKVESELRRARSQQEWDAAELEKLNSHPISHKPD